MADDGETSATTAVASSPVQSGLEAGMATLTFKAINEPQSPDQGGDQAVDKGESSAGNADGARSKENRRRTASLERYRPGAYGSTSTKEEREKHRNRGHLGENRLEKTGSDNKPEGGGRKGGRGNRGDRRNRNKRGGANKGLEGGSAAGPNDAAPENGDTEAAPETLAEPDSPMVLGGKRNWADYSFDEDLPVDPEPPVVDQPTRKERSNRSPKQAAGPQQQTEDLRNKLNRNRRQQQQQNGSHHHNSNSSGGGGRGGSTHSSSGTGRKPLPRPKKNTENFNPCHDPPDMRVLCAPPGLSRYTRPYSTRDVAVVTDLFVQDVNDYRIYNQLLDEIQKSGVDERVLWQRWHGDSHLIADDKKNWKKHCPTFAWVVDKLATYFDMNVQATRLNWYTDTDAWKPFHHDAAAVKPDKARTQNMTVAVSFGAERDAAFEHAQTKTVISMPQPNGTVYTFGKDVNLIWRHGIPQVHPNDFREEGRISIICWGWMEMFDM